MDDKKNKSTPVIHPLVTKPELAGYGEQTSWLIQPLEVSMMYQEFGLSQIRAMLTVIRLLQTPINNVINGADAKGQLLLFKQNDYGLDQDVIDDGIVLELKMKDLTNDHSQYKAIREVIRRMQTMNVSYIHHNKKDGRDYRIIEPFIRKFVVPPDKQRITGMLVVLSPQIAEMIVNMDGYSWHRILENVILESSNTSTQCLYLYLSAMRTKGKKRAFDVTPVELRRQAGTTHVFYNENGEVIDQKVGYSQWGMFVKKVLKAAEDELKEKFDEHKCDMYFKWSPIYREGNPKKGEPDLIHIETFAFDDNLLAVGEELDINLDSIRAIAVDKFGIRINNFSYFKNLITNKEIHDLFLEQLKRLDADVQGDKRNPKYFYACCKKAIDTIVAELNQPKPESKPSSSSARDSLLSALQYEFGNGQMGYDYFFGDADVSIADTNVTFYVNQHVTGQLSSFVHADKINKCVRALFGAHVICKIEPKK